MSGSRWVILFDYLVCEDLFCTVLLCILAISSQYLLLLLGPYHFCPLLSPSLHEMFPWYLKFSGRDRESFPFCCLPLFLCIDHWERLSYLSLLFFGTLYSDVYIFPFLLCFSLLFFSQLFVRPPQTGILLFCISFPWGWSWSLYPVQCHEPLSIVHQALCLSDLVP